MEKLQGIAVSPGVAIGEALVIDNEGFRIPRRFVSRDAVVDELERLEKAIAAAGMEIARNRDAVTQELGEQYGKIFEAHLQMLQGAHLRSELEEMISQRHYSPEYAVSRTLRRYAEVLQRVEGSLAERATDIFDIEKRLLKHLLGRRREDIAHLTSPVLVLAHNLTPSETANLDRRFVRGFATEVGGPGSHTAIVAEALEIPAVVGLGSFLHQISGGDLVILDGDKGLVILQPDDDTLAHYRREAEELRLQAARLEPLRDLPAQTRDGVRVQLQGNIEFPYEVEHCLDRGADGIGLYRTEFLYIESGEEPTEEVHFEAYCHVVKAMNGKPVTIRTFDMGADKLPRDDAVARDEKNPFLGLRSIRLALRNVPMFRTQLRALLRASVLGKVKVMFPLVSTLMELRQARMFLRDVMEDLDEHGIPFDREVPVGMMVEVPAAVMMLDQFAAEVDFLSIGTNDLIQYTLAVDRSNLHVVHLYNPTDPAVLKLIRMSIDAAERADVPINMCGQMSATPAYAPLLLGLGLRQFSVPPLLIPEIKNIIRHVAIDECQAMAARALGMENARDIHSYLTDEFRKRIPGVGA